MLAFLDPQLDAFGDAGHDLYVVATEAQLFGHQAGDGAAQDGLGAQRRVLLPQCQGPATHRGRASGRPAGMQASLLKEQFTVKSRTRLSFVEVDESRWKHGWFLL